MKLTVLTENIAGGDFLAEHGLSYLIEFNGKYILFDTGHSNVFIKNAELLNIDLNKTVDAIILSHGHWDHGNGLEYLSEKKLITHPLAFIKRYRKNQTKNIGLKLSQVELSKNFDLTISAEPYKIYDDIYFLGTIPKQNNFEAKTTAFVDEKGIPDFIPDDSALAIVNNNELIIISGCAHSGICNIIEHAKKACNISKVKAVIGGFHLKENNMQTKRTIQYLKKEGIENIHPSHCTEFEALTAFATEFRIKITKTGSIINY